MTPPLQLGILLSGGGTTFHNLHREIEAGRLNARITCVVSSRSKVAGLERARELGYPAYFIGRKKYDSDEAYSRVISEKLAHHDVKLVVLAGFLRRYLPAPAYARACLNIHPSLLPSFCGQGYYGMKVHQAVWERSCKVSGCTVHLVDDQYDQGPIVVQKSCPIDDRDTPEDIQRKVFELECEAYPEAITYFIEDRIRFENGRSIIQPRH